MTPEPDTTETSPGEVFERVENQVDQRENWARRRRKDIPTDEQLLVIACMDERIPVEEVLDLSVGDAHVFRNAGGEVTDDVIRSAALSTTVFDTNEIIVLNHTDCGMMSASDEAVVDGLEAAVGGTLEDVDLNPALPGFDIGDASIADWVWMTEDIDEACQIQVDYLTDHPLIPEDVSVHGYVYEVESDSLRRPGERIAEGINTRVSE
ncbi:MAG: beta-class carbonic anhydrase [Halodesulfurarchaeum sp.]